MVGTAEYQVAQESRTVRQNESGLKRDGTATVPPASKVESVEATSPCTWKSGMRHSETSSGDRRYVSTMLRAETARLTCFSGTRLGRPVEPLVCRTRATSPGAGEETGRRLAAPGIRTSPEASVSTGRMGILRSA